MSGLKQSFVTKLTDIDTSAKEPLGTLRFEGNKVYKYVMIENHSAAVAGAVGAMCGYYAVTGYGNNRVVVDLSDADNPPMPAGALQAAFTGSIDTIYYGWIQIKGLATVDTAVTNGTAGAPCYLTATDKTLARANEADSAAVYKAVAGLCMNTTTGVVLDCPW